MDISANIVLAFKKAAGIADFKACNSETCKGHYAHDVAPYNLAKALDRENDYYLVRPRITTLP